MNDKPGTFENVKMNNDQVAQSDSVRNAAQELEILFDEAVSREERSEASRLMNIARTNLEQSIMWAIKAISRK